MNKITSFLPGHLLSVLILRKRADIKIILCEHQAKRKGIVFLVVFGKICQPLN